MTALAAPRAIIFDWDNTLIDSWVCILEAMNATFRHMEMPEWTLEQAKAQVALSMRDSFPAMFGNRWEEARDVFYATFNAIHISHLAPLPGAEEMLAGLAEAGIYLGVVSNKNGAFLRKEAAHLGWDRFFGRLVGATDAAQDKPHRAPVDMVLENSGIAPGPHVWFVGDALVDLTCGHNAGCTPILVRAEPARAGEFDSYPPKSHLAGCAELATLVRELSIPICRN